AVAVSDNADRFAFLGSRSARWSVVGATLIAAIYFVLIAPDPLLPQYQLTFETNDLAKRLQFGAQLQVTTILLPGIALLAFYISLNSIGGAGRQVKSSRRAGRLASRAGKALLAAAISYALASWLVLDVAQARAEYATIYEYGRRGGVETSALVRGR